MEITLIDHCAPAYFNCNDAAQCDVLIIEKKEASSLSQDSNNGNTGDDKVP